MGKMTIPTILMVSISTLAFAIGPQNKVTVPTEQQTSQNNAGAWVDDWWENVVETNKQLKESSSDQPTVSKCSEKIKRYQQKVDIHQNSEYYLMKLNKWEKRCDPVN